MSEVLRTLVPVKAILLIIQFLLFLTVLFTRVSHEFVGGLADLVIFRQRGRDSEIISCLVTSLKKITEVCPNSKESAIFEKQEPVILFKDQLIDAP